MKKVENKFIVVYAALGTYFFVIGTALVFNIWASKVEAHNKAVIESINTAEDMIGWIVEDVANEYLDSTIADTYIDNLEEIIEDLK
tara:strand:- start:16 stop:273 length:258 start_codon:yes stop_codon:yes gene_type:complete